MSVLLLIFGIVLLAVISSDVLVTTLTLRGGGFLTDRFSSWLWHGATKIHRYHSNHRLLAAIGLLLVLGMAFLWYFMTWVAWSLIMKSLPPALRDEVVVSALQGAMALPITLKALPDF